MIKLLRIGILLVIGLIAQSVFADDLQFLTGPEVVNSNSSVGILFFNTNKNKVYTVHQVTCLNETTGEYLSTCSFFSLFLNRANYVDQISIIPETFGNIFGAFYFNSSLLLKINVGYSDGQSYYTRSQEYNVVYESNPTTLPTIFYNKSEEKQYKISCSPLINTSKMTAAIYTSGRVNNFILYPFSSYTTGTSSAVQCIAFRINSNANESATYTVYNAESSYSGKIINIK